MHGAANGAWVWDAWRDALRPLGWQVNVLDLRGHGRSLPTDMTGVSMEDYASDIESVAGQIAEHYGANPVIGGWSMGGLLAMMHTAKHPETPALLLFAPSPPSEGAPVSEQRAVPLAPIGPEAFGIYPEDPERSRPAIFDLNETERAEVLAHSAGALESGLAFRQRLRGIDIPEGSIGCPSLLIWGECESLAGRHLQTAELLQSTALSVPNAGHWGIVASRHVVADLAPAVDDWLRGVLQE